MTATGRALATAVLGAAVVATAVATAPAALADSVETCVRNGGGLVSVDGAEPVPPVFGFDGLRLLGLEGGVGNACITNVGPGAVTVTHPEGRIPGRTEVSTALVEMRVDGGLGNVAVTNVGSGAVTVRRTEVTPEPAVAPAPAPEPGMPEMILDAGTDGVFVTNVGTGGVTVVDRKVGPSELPAPPPPPPGAVIVDPVTGNIYVTNLFGPDIVVAEAVTATGASVVERPVPGTAIAYGTRNVFVTNIGGGQVTVVRG
ncbi:hypothetical protein [Rhodococcus sp. NPDC047139]|uniref:hypothetical protein n=1 Tax=Rhodococcus sp. NPDC047139 TaxID=3155141 RepID=UPI0033D02196